MLESGQGVWVPVGFAHGFQALEDSIMLYLMSEELDESYYRCVKWDDSSVGVNWPLRDCVILSERDKSCPVLSLAEIFN